MIIMVMVMSKRFILGILITMVLGVVTAKVVYSKTILKNDLKENNLIYFLQLGVYIDEDTMNDDIKNIENKLILQEDNKYYVYVGISKSKNNLKKISKLYEDKGYSLYIKEQIVMNNEFLINLEQFDKLLKEANSMEEISTINSVILSSYEEMVIS